jgi:pimeloyl-ACP methyl ester carboxylesterase
MTTRARLHHERLGPADATRLVLFTHGIYGSGTNWRAIARQVVARAPGWAAVLVDLRLHGRSTAGAPPHTVAACVGDLAALCAALAAAGPPVVAAVGHSFGGKVVLGLDLPIRVILDSTPSARVGAWDAPGNSVRAAWESMAALDRTWARREDFVAALIARGHPAPMAGWLAMNLDTTAAGLRLRLDLAAIHALVTDYYAVDAWPAIDAARRRDRDGGGRARRHRQRRGSGAPRARAGRGHDPRHPRRRPLAAPRRAGRGGRAGRRRARRVSRAGRRAGLTRT